MKKILSLVLICGVVLAVLPNTANAALEDRTLVRLEDGRIVFVDTVDWDNDTQTVSAESENFSLSLTIDRFMADINGQRRSLGFLPFIVDGRTMIPLRVISEMLGYTVEWVEETQTISINTQ